MSLSGRTVVITGSARGVGFDIAQKCAQLGARLVLGDILDDLGREAALRLQTDGAKVRFHSLDLGDPRSIEDFAHAVKQHEGKIDGLVNNAALATDVGGAPLEEIDIDLWDRVMKINVRGTWLMTRAMSPLFAKEGGQIVNLASDTALWGPPRLLAYLTSKGAVISMTRGMARELGSRRIGVTSVAPGLMKNQATDYVPASRHAQNEEGRAVPGPIHPTDIVDVIAFLLTPSALVLTGQVLPLNSGFIFN